MDAMGLFGLKNLPEDNKLNRVYRIGAGLIGVWLLTFGVLGFFDQLAFFDTEGDRVAGLSTNVVLSTISVVVGLVLIAGAFIGGNVSAQLNFVLGVLFLVSGFANMCVLRTSWNILNFSMANVIFSFVTGLALLTFGLYGRVSGGLPADNPYYRARHGLDPRTGEVVDQQKVAAIGPARGSEDTPARRRDDTGPDPRV
ncbi:MAG TPA: DUF4383 domain-containing protein [Mycobacteriales bacterium]|nr:DUF4383 domain-containing protein [Mycobacteriales bacterium]